MDDKISMKEIRATWVELLQDKLAIICFMENPTPNGEPIIAGLNMTYPCVKKSMELGVSKNEINPLLQDF